VLELNTKSLTRESAGQDNLGWFIRAFEKKLKRHPYHNTTDQYNKRWRSNTNITFNIISKQCKGV